MSLTTIAIAALLVMGATVGAYVKGRDDGKELQIATQSKLEDAVKAGAAAAADTAASAILGISIKQVTIKQRTEHETSTVPVYAECHHSPDGLRSVNDALTNTAGVGPASGGQLPASAASR